MSAATCTACNDPACKGCGRLTPVDCVICAGTGGVPGPSCTACSATGKVPPAVARQQKAKRLADRIALEPVVPSGPGRLPGTCRSCGKPSHHGAPCQLHIAPQEPAILSLDDIAAALMQHSAAAFSSRNDARALRLRDIADELLQGPPAAPTSHDC